MPAPGKTLSQAAINIDKQRNNKSKYFSHQSPPFLGLYCLTYHIARVRIQFIERAELVIKFIELSIEITVARHKLRTTALKAVGSSPSKDGSRAL